LRIQDAVVADHEGGQRFNNTGYRLHILT